jgi:hypothetical protein
MTLSLDSNRLDSGLVKTRGVGLILAVSMFFIYWTAPVLQIADSCYALLLSHSMLFERSLDLHAYFSLPLQPRTHPGTENTLYPNQMTIIDNHVYYYFPLGSSLLAAPVVAVAHVFGFSPVGPGRFDYNVAGEAALQRLLAAALTAFWCWLVFVTCRLRLGTVPSIFVTLAAGLGTQALSTASRGMWSDTWGLVLLQAALWLLLRGARPHPALLGSLLAWLYFVRPTYSIAIVIIMLLMAALRWWGMALWTSAVGACWLTGFVAFSRHYYGASLPPYYQASRLTFEHVGTALLGNLVSPSRGLLLYVPSVLVTLVALSVVWKRVDLRLSRVALSAVVVHLLATSGYGQHWWGGLSYGPRLMTGALPWLVILAIQSLAGLLSSPRRRALMTIMALAAVVSVATNLPGAFSSRAIFWNVYPLSVDEHPERVWDWHDPQFLAALRPR